MIDIKDLGVLIRADAGSGSIPATQIGGRLSRTHASKTHAILIDFEDSFGPNYANRRKERVKHYLSHGWEIHGPVSKLPAVELL